MELRYLCIGIIALWSLGSAHEAKDFDDSILYKIDFEIPAGLNDKEFKLKYRIPKFYTHDKEEYSCAIPIIEETLEEKTLDYTGLSPLQLIRPMFSSISCSYRIEAYWCYEICHGFHIKQYHEEREGKNVKFQEYHLGRWSDEKQEQLIQKLTADRVDGIKFKTTKIDNVHYPYLELDMGNGTLCDLNNEPRTTKIRYVCYPHGKNTIYSFKETSSCNYEAIILTSLLCVHPAFLPEESKEIPIKCFNNPRLAHKPLSMLKQALEDLEMTDFASKFDVIVNERRFSVEILNDPQKVVEFLSPAPPPLGSPEITDGPPQVVAINENELLKWEDVNLVNGGDSYKMLYDFLFGKCLIGGTGWWSYEFCYGRHVRQFHKDKQSETEVILGHFKDNVHRDWLKSHPAKRLRRKSTGSETAIWHHYEGGSRCDKTGKPRETDVKLMCVVASTMSSVSMYLLEPKTCQYILVVESPLVCAMKPMVDEDGIITKEGFRKIVYLIVKKHIDEISKEEGTSAAVEDVEE